jgi:hypothetical protein
MVYITLKLKRKLNKLLLPLVIFFILPASAAAQMFSVEEPERRSRVTTNSVTIGLDFVDMSLRPDDPEISPVYHINEPVYQVRLQMPGFDAYAGYRTRFGGKGEDSDTLSYLNLGLSLSGSMPLAAAERYSFLLPLRLSTDFTRVRSIHSQPEAEQFRQSALSIGIGAGFVYRFSPHFRLYLESIPQIGFTVTALGTDSGQMVSLNSRARLQYDQLAGRFGLALGYHHTFRRYSGGDERFHYDIQSHNFIIGVTF